MVGNRTGIIFNNEMDDFSTPGTVNNYGVSASPTNFIVPGKRPMSSMSPTIIMNKDGSLAGIIGASGGTRIITGTLEVCLNMQGASKH
jgi:gamma-glutamyltranspeptidase/glutathione hydrolase/leukotriene-C4 hydrolase